MNAMLESQLLLSRPGHVVDYLGSKLFVPLGHFDEEHLLSGGVPEGHVMDTFKRLVQTGDIVLDVGANIGTHAFALASLVGPEGLVYAVEADVDNVASIRTSLTQSASTNIMLLAVAASDRISVIHALASARTNSTFSDKASESEVKVACTVPLDSVIDKVVSFIKLDIEGAELLAIYGMTQIIETSRPLVLMEFSPRYMEHALGSDRSAELFDFFALRDYGCWYIDPYRNIDGCPSLPSLIAAHAAALERFSWNHIDIIFVPNEKSIASGLRQNETSDA